MNKNARGLVSVLVATVAMFVGSGARADSASCHLELIGLQLKTVCEVDLGSTHVRCENSTLDVVVTPLGISLLNGECSITQSGPNGSLSVSDCTGTALSLTLNPLSVGFLHPGGCTITATTAAGTTSASCHGGALEIGACTVGFLADAQCTVASGPAELVCELDPSLELNFCGTPTVLLQSDAACGS